MFSRLLSISSMAAATKANKVEISNANFWETVNFLVRCSKKGEILTSDGFNTFYYLCT